MRRRTNNATNSLAEISGVPISELLGVGKCKLHRRTPYGMTNVRLTQFSVARFSGSCIFNGDYYIYRPEVDELIRDDVLAWVIKRQKRKTPNTKVTDADP